MFQSVSIQPELYGKNGFFLGAGGTVAAQGDNLCIQAVIDSGLCCGSVGSADRSYGAKRVGRGIIKLKALVFRPTRLRWSGFAGMNPVLFPWLRY